MTVQSTLFSKITKAAIALPVVVGMTLAAGSAEAAGLAGSFQIGNLFTKINLSNEGIDFSNPLTDPLAEVEITSATGDFVGFQSAFIKDLLPSNLAPIESFLDLSVNQAFPLGALNVADDVFTFDVVTSSGLLVSQADFGVLGLSVELDGLFISDTGETSTGQSILTFQFAEAGITVEDFEARLAGGEEFDGITFSGAAFTATTDIPEPATILGLLAISGLAGTSIRKRKATDA
jgi:hypothetical protein